MNGTKQIEAEMVADLLKASRELLDSDGCEDHTVEFFTYLYDPAPQPGRTAVS